MIYSLDMCFLEPVPGAHSASLEFWGTLLAGIIGATGAFGGVWFQRRSERRERLKEQERQRIEIARALLIEVAGFRNDILEGVRRNLVGMQLSTLQSTFLKSPPVSPFPVYRANANRIGEFETSEVEAVVSFYNVAEGFLSDLDRFVELQIRISVSQVSGSWANAAVANLGKLQEMMPRVAELAAKAASALASRAKVHFAPDTFDIRAD